MDNNYHRIKNALTYIRQNFKDQPTLEEVAEHVHLSPYHFHRIFKDWAGVTPKKFLQFITFNQAKKKLKDDLSIEDATFQSGLSSSSRLHDLFVNFEGITPGEFKNRGESLEIFYALHESSFGNYFIAVTKRGVCNLTFTQQMDWILDKMRIEWPGAEFIYAPPKTLPIADKLFNQNKTDSHDVSLLVKGNTYELKIWEALLNIPFGDLVTYRKLAEFLDIEHDISSIENVLLNNPVKYIIPCHRVIKNLSSDEQYTWGNTDMLMKIGWEASKTETVKTS